MIPRERCAYSAIVDRPPLVLPNRARLVVWTIVNLEFWDISRPMARQVLPAPTGQVLLPDVPNWAWHEYGMRVGVWRFFELFARLAIRPTLSINARVCEEYARVAGAAREAGWEFMGHAWEQMPIHKVEDQFAMINQSLGVLERFAGTRPVGWLGPGLTETEDTPDLLAAAGVKYIGDWVYDDEPTEIRTAHGPLVTLPYTVELNDIPMMLVQHHEIGLLHAALHRQLRAALPRGRRAGEDHGDRDPPLYQRATASHQIPRSRIRPYQPLRRRPALERRRDSRLVQHGAAKGLIMAEPIMLPTDRLDYSPIASRPKLSLPDGARLVVWIIVNVEEWDPREVMPRTVLTPPAGGAPMPDIPNWAWHEYGNRVGFWRMLEAIDEHRIRAVLAVNGSAIRRYEPIARAARDRGWEFIGHGFTQKNMQKVADERDDIRKTAAAIRDFTGKNPRGWLGPGLSETWETPDLLVEEGYEYVCDWVLDDEPVLLRTRTKPIVGIPYTQECNDVAMMLIQHHKATEYYDRAVDQFDQLYRDSAASARVMALVVHPYVMGAPHRLKYFRAALAHIRAYRDVLFWTGAEILDWYRAQSAQ